MILKNKTNMTTWFIAMSVIGFSFTALMLFLSHGNAFNQFFFFDSNDTGMDFFHSIEYVKDRVPYEKYNTLYPPLANLFFYILIRFVPVWQSNTWTEDFHQGIAVRGTSIDLRVWQPTMLLFMAFIIFVTLCTVFLIRACFKYDTNKTNAVINMFAVSTLLSYGVLYSFERGNIILLSFLACLFFERYRDSDNTAARWLALLMLAISVGFKIYPAIFGMLLIYDKRKKEILPTVLMGVALITLPTLIFNEGFSGLSIFLNNISEQSADTTVLTDGFCFNRIVNTVVALICSLFNKDVNTVNWLSAVPKFNIAIAALILVCGFFLKKRWEKLLACCVAMLLYAFQYPYATVFFLIPFITMIREEININKNNALIFFTFIFSTIMLPIKDIDGFPISLVYARFQIAIVIFTVYIIAQAIRGFIDKIKKPSVCEN